MKNPEQLTLLFEKYITRSCSTEETQRLMDYFHVSEDQELLKEMVITALGMQDDNYRENPVIAMIVAQVDEDLFKQIQANHESSSSKGIVKLWPRLGIAAAIVLIIGSLALMLNLFKSPNLGVSMSSTYKNNIAPGREGATLTLANGQKIKLTDAVNGKLAEEAGLVITKSADGQIVYEMKDKGNNVNSTNTLSTAKGETYQVLLPDGSLVSLNAASSLTYATSLNERGERRVRLSGEAFFEISKDKKHPFIVESRGQEVKVLGTQFNINAYDDEVSIKTTLLEGSVKVLGERDVMLKPGEQARNLGNSISVSKVDTELATAWKNNQFIFESQDIQAIMRMISRWYNVEVVYQGEVPIHKFSWSISRFEYVSEVLQSLESTAEVRFQIEGRRIIVRK